MTTRDYLLLFSNGEAEVRAFPKYLEATKCETLIANCRDDLNSPFSSFLALLPALSTIPNAEFADETLRLPNSILEESFASGDDPLKGVAPKCLFTLVVESVGAIALPNFTFRYFFKDEKGKVAVRPWGVFAQYQEKILRLYPRQSLAVSLIEEFNSFDGTKRARKAMEFVNRLQQVQDPGRVSLSKYLTSESYLSADAIVLKAQDEKGILNIAPTLPGLETDELVRAFNYFSEVQNTYNLTIGGKITRVIIPESTKPILEEVKKHGRVLSGEQRKAVIKNPFLLFGANPDINRELISVENWAERYGTNLTDAVVLSFGSVKHSFGPRVIGFSEEFKQGVVQAPPTDIDWFSGFPMEGGDFPSPEITVTTVDGRQIALSLPDKEKVEELERSALEAKRNDQESFLFDGLQIPLSNQLLEAIRTVAVQLAPKLQEKKKKFVLKVVENSESLAFEAPRNEVSSEISEKPYSPPKSLRGLELKNHQIEGVRWLLRKFEDGSPGVLMADDMGLGKTLQILTFAAHCIEEKLIAELANEKPPYQPILIVCPKILFDTWLEKHIKENFNSLFMPFLKLHGSTLSGFLKPDINKDDPLEVKLKIDEICENRLVLTNYDTLANHQTSLCRIDWSLIVFDEAQKIKEPNTSASIAAKATKGRFKIACTGTPVENHLGNLFSLFDTVYPGRLLGSAREFRETFGIFPDTPPDETREKLQKLRERIGVNEKSGYLIRRSKEDCASDFKTKNFVVQFCDLSEQQEQLYETVVSEVRVSHNLRKGGVLEGLIKLQQICEHPFLLEDYPLRHTTDELLKSCPKLRATIELLNQIKGKGEKVLVFARFKDMQQILQRTILDECGFKSQIINGTTTKHAEKIISDFAQGRGFGALILSPDVAGVGLTITAANHVIH
ncbi:DEAD/DEAH box helicase, partial [bacterium]|nr:DEAD/DEAH box helicase [bacterium]